MKSLQSFKSICATATLLASAVSLNVNAAFISGDVALSNGSDVALQGLEWMPLTYTAGLSRTDIEDGFTDRFGNTWEAGEWRYASRNETENLINSLWDKTVNGWSNGNFVGAAWFLNNFGAISFDTGYGEDRVNGVSANSFWQSYDRSLFFFGDDGDCVDNQEGASCRGLVQVGTTVDSALYSVNVENGVQALPATPAGWLEDHFGGRFGIEESNSSVPKTFTFQYTGETDNPMGSLLVRKLLEVPAPSALSLLAIGLMGTSVRRRRPS